MIPSAKDLAEYARILAIDPDSPLQPVTRLVDAAASDVPVILRDSPERDPYLPNANPDSGATIVGAPSLIYLLAQRGHDRSAASWAIYRLVERGFLGAEMATIYAPPTVDPSPSPQNECELREQKPDDSAGDTIHPAQIVEEQVALFQIPISTTPGPVHVPPNHGGSGRTAASAVDQFSYLVVWPVDELWDWWRHTPSAALAVPEEASDPTSKATPPRIVAQSQRVALFGPEHGPIVRGKKKNPLRPIEYKLISKLIEKGERRASKTELEKISSDYWRTLDRLRKADPDWRAVIHFPGKSHGGYSVE